MTQQRGGSETQLITPKINQHNPGSNLGAVLSFLIVKVTHNVVLNLIYWYLNLCGFFKGR